MFRIKGLSAGARYELFLYLWSERQWNMYIPGFSDDIRGFRKPILHSVHSSRQSIVSRAKYETACLHRSQSFLENGSKSPNKEDILVGDDGDLIIVNSEATDRDL